MVRAAQDAKPNKLLKQLRDQQAWTQKDAVTAFNDLASAMNKKAFLDANALSRYERGIITWPDAATRSVLATLYSVPPDALGFRHRDGSRPEPSSLSPDTGVIDGFNVTSHKFVPAFIGRELAESWAGALEPAELDWMHAAVGAVEYAGSACNVYVFPFGVAVFHIQEEKRLPSLGQLAVWRRSSYEQAVRWATDKLSAQFPAPSVGCPPRAAYVLSAYWLQSPKWREQSELQTAMNLLSMPSVMLDREPGDDVEDVEHAELAEAELFRDGFDHPEMYDFGLRGVSIGCASWAGVSYYALAPRRALTADEIACFELIVQALWCYSDHVIRCDEEQLSADYDHRFLRSCLAELRLARGLETTQHRLMRHAILETSQLSDLLGQAQRVLEERALTPTGRQS